MCALFYIYIGYPFLLLVARFFYNKPYRQFESELQSVSVVISAYNEEKVIKKRIENLLSVDFSKDKYEIVICSDGSTDQTVEIAQQFENIRVLDFSQNRGRARVQNDAVNEARGDIVLFTDAETEFEEAFLARIVGSFSDPKVGCAVGNLIYRTTDTAVGTSEGFYWQYEKKLRKIESDLGILATATGACMAMRKELWRTLSPIDDCDFTTPLDVIVQGYRVVYLPEAIAYDVPASSMRGEFRTRVRQTSKNLIGTLQRWGWSNWLKHPVVSWSLLSHKILRWLTPFLMIATFISNVVILDEGLSYQITFVVQTAFYIMAILGLVGEVLEKEVRVVSIVFSFCVANVGIGIGVIKGLIGNVPAAYKNEQP